MIIFLKDRIVKRFKKKTGSAGEKTGKRPDYIKMIIEEGRIYTAACTDNAAIEREEKIKNTKTG